MTNFTNITNDPARIQEEINKRQKYINEYERNGELPQGMTSKRIEIFRNDVIQLKGLMVRFEQPELSSSDKVWISTSGTGTVIIEKPVEQPSVPVGSKIIPTQQVGMYSYGKLTEESEGTIPIQTTTGLVYMEQEKYLQGLTNRKGVSEFIKTNEPISEREIQILNAPYEMYRFEKEGLKNEVKTDFDLSKVTIEDVQNSLMEAKSIQQDKAMEEILGGKVLNKGFRTGNIATIGAGVLFEMGAGAYGVVQFGKATIELPFNTFYGMNKATGKYESSLSFKPLKEYGIGLGKGIIELPKNLMERPISTSVNLFITGVLFKGAGEFYKAKAPADLVLFTERVNIGVKGFLKDALKFNKEEVVAGSTFLGKGGDIVGAKEVSNFMDIYVKPKLFFSKSDVLESTIFSKSFKETEMGKFDIKQIENIRVPDTSNYFRFKLKNEVPGQTQAGIVIEQATLFTKLTPFEYAKKLKKEYGLKIKYEKLEWNLHGLFSTEPFEIIINKILKNKKEFPPGKLIKSRIDKEQIEHYRKIGYPIFELEGKEIFLSLEHTLAHELSHARDLIESIENKGFLPYDTELRAFKKKMELKPLFKVRENFIDVSDLIFKKDRVNLETEFLKEVPDVFRPFIKRGVEVEKFSYGNVPEISFINRLRNTPLVRRGVEDQFITFDVKGVGREGGSFVTSFKYLRFEKGKSFSGFGLQQGKTMFLEELRGNRKVQMKVSVEGEGLMVSEMKQFRLKERFLYDVENKKVKEGFKQEVYSSPFGFGLRRLDVERVPFRSKEVISVGEWEKISDITKRYSFEPIVYSKKVFGLETPPEQFYLKSNLRLEQPSIFRDLRFIDFEQRIEKVGLINDLVQFSNMKDVIEYDVSLRSDVTATFTPKTSSFYEIVQKWNSIIDLNKLVEKPRGRIGTGISVEPKVLVQPVHLEFVRGEPFNLPERSIITKSKLAEVTTDEGMIDIFNVRKTASQNVIYKRDLVRVEQDVGVFKSEPILKEITESEFLRRIKEKEILKERVIPREIVLKEIIDLDRLKEVNKREIKKIYDQIPSLKENIKLKEQKKTPIGTGRNMFNNVVERMREQEKLKAFEVQEFQMRVPKTGFLSGDLLRSIRERSERFYPIPILRNEVFSSTQSIQDFKNIELYKLRSDLNKIQESRLNQEMKLNQESRLNQEMKLNQESRLNQELKQNLLQEQKVQQKQKQNVKMKMNVPIELIPRPKPPMKYTGFGITHKEGVFFKVFVKRFGRYELKGAYSNFETALRKGEKVVSNTASASLKIQKPSGAFADLSSYVNEQFRTSRKTPVILVERRGKRIKSFGEKEEITMKGIEARRFGRAWWK